MKIVTSEEMREIDREASERFGISPLVLMENAGRSMAAWFRNTVPEPSKHVLRILAGGGNNGGDGMVMGRHLFLAGYRVEIGLIEGKNGCSPETSTNKKIAHKIGIPLITIDSSETLGQHLAGCTIIIDALLGTGLSGEVTGFKAEAINMINRQPALCISLDVPSGYRTNPGAPQLTCVNADHTLTVALPKPGMLQDAGTTPLGRLTIVPIGFPPALLSNPALQTNWADHQLVRALVPTRAAAAHKGTMGRVKVIAGSQAYPGAALLAAEGAAAGGAGLVQVCFPSAMDRVGLLSAPWIIPRALPDGGRGCFCGESLASTELTSGDDSAAAPMPDALVVGPGMGRDPDTTEVVRSLLAFGIPTVLDADGLFHLAKILETGERPTLPKTIILTPHPGELKRLIAALEGSVTPAQDASGLAKTLAAIIVAKDWQTVVHTPEGATYRITAGHPALARGGTGDVLAGCIGGLLARGMDPTDAAILTVWSHARAGSAIARERGEDSLLPETLAKRIPRIFQELREMDSTTNKHDWPVQHWPREGGYAP